MTDPERCAFCERAATTKVEILPALHHYPKGKKTLKRLAINAPVCAHHAMAVNRDRDWQRRQQEAREAQQAADREAAAAARLFDPARLGKRRTRRRQPGRKPATRTRR
jgi:hypothetical protein